MKRHLSLLAALLLAAGASAQVPESISYQVVLDSSGVALDGTADIEVRLYDQAVAGNLAWSRIYSGLSLTEGIVSIPIESGTPPLSDVTFDEPLWMEVRVNGQVVSPRTQLASVPYALGVRGITIDPVLDRIGIGTSAPSSPLTVAGVVESTSGGFKFPDGTQQSTASATGWGLGGNGGTNPGTDYLGTSDNKPLEIKTNGARTLRLEPETATEGPKVIAGYSGNSVSAGAIGATISGGGSPSFGGGAEPNQVTNIYGTIGGGLGNTAGARSATVGGGEGSVAGGAWSTVAGGWDNETSAERTTVAGGHLNRATGIGGTVGGGLQNRAEGTWSVVGGGNKNIASGSFSMVPGGWQNVADKNYGLAAGYKAKSLHRGTFVWNDFSVTSGNDSLVSTGDNQFLVRAAGGFGLNTTTPAGDLDISEVFKVQSFGTGGNNQNVRLFFSESADNKANGYSLIYAGATAPQTFDGTQFNLAANALHFVRHDNSTGGVPVLAMERTTGQVGVGTESPDEVLHLLNPSGGTGLKLGGESTIGPHGVIFDDDTPDQGVQLLFRTAPNRLTLEKTSAGTETDGVDAFWFDRDDDLFHFSGEVAINRTSASHPLHIGTNVANGNGARLTASGIWTNGSSRTFKEGFQEVDSRELLDKLAAMPVTRWRYRGEESVEHIGPVAEDFAASFGLGDDEKYIGTVDADGVALAAIQGLYEILREQAEEIALLKSEMADLRGR